MQSASPSLSSTLPSFTGTRDTTAALQCLAVAVLASGCGAVMGWHGRGWRTRHATRAYTRRERRHRNALWLLPSPTNKWGPPSLRAWVAACVGQRWTPQCIWMPALLRQYAAPAGVATDSKEALAEAARWGTRELCRLQGLHRPESSPAAAATACTLRSTAGTVRSASRTRGEAVLPWQPLSSHEVDLFTSPASGGPSPSSSSSVSTVPQWCTPLRVLPRHAFALLYDPLARLPLWCGYHLTRASADQARRQRRCINFYADRTLDKAARRVPAEVHQRHYDRGHLAPHASVATTPQAAVEASLLTNVVLQYKDVNRGAWRWLEAATRAYVRVPYDHDTTGSTSAMASGEARVRRDGLLLARLLAGATPFASAHDARKSVQRRRWWRLLGGGDKDEGGRHLCVNVGPLFYPDQSGSVSVKKAHKGNEALATSSSRHTAPPRHRQRRATTAAATADVPDALFLSLWDARTHHHVHLVLPNTTDTPAMRRLTLALAAWASSPQKQQQSAVLGVTEKGKVVRRRRRRVRRHCTTSASAGTVSEAERVMELALTAFVVPPAQMEALFAQSVVEARRRAVGVVGSATPPLSLRCGFSFFPVHRERWVWQTRWQQLAHHLTRRLVFLRREREALPLCR